MLKAISFDLDGTLIDSTEAIVRSFMHAMDTLGIPRPDRDRVIATIGYTTEQHFALFTEHDPEACATIYRERYAEIMLELTTLLPGAIETLESLRNRGYRLGFATSKLKKNSEIILAHLGVLDYFESRIGPREVARPKPHPDPILKAMEELEVQRHEFVYVGDTDFDVRAANAAGVRCLCVTTGYNTYEQLERHSPEAIFDNLDALTAYILANEAVASV